MVEERLELDGEVLEEVVVVVLLLHYPDLLLLFDLTPRKLADEKLDEHVKQRPQIVVSTHLLLK